MASNCRPATRSTCAKLKRAGPVFIDLTDEPDDAPEMKTQKEDTCGLSGDVQGPDVESDLTFDASLWAIPPDLDPTSPDGPFPDEKLDDSEVRTFWK